MSDLGFYLFSLFLGAVCAVALCCVYRLMGGDDAD